MEGYLLLLMIIVIGALVFFGMQVIGNGLANTIQSLKPGLMSTTPHRWLREFIAVYVFRNKHFTVPENRPWYEKEAAYGMTVLDMEIVNRALRERARDYDPSWVEHLEYMESIKKQRQGWLSFLR